jgi:large subunit ribosomal protein L54
VLKGIQYLKDKPDPVALDDAEYPEWLWDLLDEKKQKQKTSKPTHRQYHRKQSREAIKAMNFMKDKKN